RLQFFAIGATARFGAPAIGADPFPTTRAVIGRVCEMSLATKTPRASSPIIPENYKGADYDRHPQSDPIIDRKRANGFRFLSDEPPPQQSESHPGDGGDGGQIDIRARVWVTAQLPQPICQPSHQRPG